MRNKQWAPSTPEHGHQETGQLSPFRDGRFFIRQLVKRSGLERQLRCKLTLALGLLFIYRNVYFMPIPNIY